MPVRARARRQRPPLALLNLSARAGGCAPSTARRPVKRGWCLGQCARCNRWRRDRLVYFPRKGAKSNVPLSLMEAMAHPGPGRHGYVEQGQALNRDSEPDRAPRPRTSVCSTKVRKVPGSFRKRRRQHHSSLNAGGAFTSCRRCLAKLTPGIYAMKSGLF